MATLTVDYDWLEVNEGEACGMTSGQDSSKLLYYELTQKEMS